MTRPVEDSYCDTFATILRETHQDNGPPDDGTDDDCEDSADDCDAGEEEGEEDECR